MWHDIFYSIDVKEVFSFHDIVPIGKPCHNNQYCSDKTVFAISNQMVHQPFLMQANAKN